MNSNDRQAMSHTRVLDDSVLFGGAASVLLIALVCWRWPVALPWLFWAWLLLIDGPHLLATGLRSWADRSRRGVDAGWQRWAWVAFAVPLAAWLVAQAAPQARSMELLLGLGVMLSWHHNLRQNEGIHAILSAQAPGADAARTIAANERRWMIWWLWLAFAASALWTPVNRQNWGIDPSNASIFDRISHAMLLLMLAFMALYAVQGWRRRQAGLSLRPWWFGFLPSGLVLSAAVLLVGWAEPMYPAAQSPEQMFMAVTLIVGWSHGTQYLLVALASHRRRAHAARTWLWRSAHHPVLTLLALAGISVTLYGAINAFKGTLPALQWADGSSALGQAAMALYWALFFHHYYVDRYIWRIRTVPELRRELGLAHD